MNHDSHLSNACSLLQKSHLASARNELDQAKALALQACNALNEELKRLGKAEKDQASLQLCRALATLALEYYQALKSKGAQAMKAQDKVLWLSSEINGTNWFPVFSFGDYTSAQIPPLPLELPAMKLPKLPAEYQIKFRVPENSDDVITSTEHLEFYQDILSNCSFVLSLLSISGGGLSSSLQLLVHVHGNMAKVTLHLNGCFREVSVPIHLPYFEPPHDNRKLVVRSEPSYMWPAVLEKAYLIALGEGYNFSGSNIAIDTYVMTGWLPEVRKLLENLNNLSELWAAKERGEILLGLGTGPMLQDLAEQLGVIPEHDYVFTGLKHEIVTLKNPWAGPDLAPSTSQTPDCPEPDCGLKEKLRSLSLGRSDSLENSVADPYLYAGTAGARHLLVSPAKLFHFKYLYVNWRPEHNLRSQVTFVRQPSPWPTGYLADEPQYLLRNPSKVPCDVDIFVEQFVTGDVDFCVSIWKGSFLYTTYNECVAGGEFVNFRLSTVKLTLEPETDYVATIVVRSDTSTKYSLTVHHDIPGFVLKRAKQTRELTQFDGPMRGGNWALELYLDNPQYDLVVHDEMELLLMLTGLGNVAISVFHSEQNQFGKRLINFDKAKLITSDNYQRDFFSKEVTLAPNYYKLVVSAYAPESVDYHLSVAHSGASISKILSSLGLFLLEKVFNWSHQNRHKYEVKPHYNQTQITLRVRNGTEPQHINKYRPAMRISVFDAFTRKPIVVTSQWNDSVYGVFQECTLGSNDRTYIVLIERFEVGDGYCRLSVGSSKKISVEDIGHDNE